MLFVLRQSMHLEWLSWYKECSLFLISTWKHEVISIVPRIIVSGNFSNCCNNRYCQFWLYTMLTFFIILSQLQTKLNCSLLLPKTKKKHKHLSVLLPGVDHSGVHTVSLGTVKMKDLVRNVHFVMVEMWTLLLDLTDICLLDCCARAYIAFIIMPVTVQKTPVSQNWVLLANLLAHYSSWSDPVSFLLRALPGHLSGKVDGTSKQQCRDCCWRQHWSLLRSLIFGTVDDMNTANVMFAYYQSFTKELVLSYGVAFTLRKRFVLRRQIRMLFEF